MRDDDIKNGNLSSGLPTGFQAWAFNDLKTKAADTFYAKQIKEHLGQRYNYQHPKTIKYNLLKRKAKGTRRKKRKFIWPYSY